MNNSSIKLTDSNLSSYTQSIVIGALAILANLIILYVLFRNFPLLKKSAFIFGLAVGDLSDGVALMGSGIYRILATMNGYASFRVSQSYCLQVNGFTAFFIVGNQIPGVMFLIVAIERYLAVRHFDWYFKNWTNKLAWRCTGIGYVYCAFSVSTAFLVVNVAPQSRNVSALCSSANVVGVEYTTYSYLVSIAGGLAAVVSTVYAMCDITKRKRKLENSRGQANDESALNNMKRQWSTCRTLVAVAFLQLAFVVVPNILMAIDNGVDIVRNNMFSYSQRIGCSRCILNIFIYLIVNQEFRKCAQNTFWFRQMKANQVVPVSMNNL